MGNFFTKHHKHIPKSTVIPNEIKEAIDKIMKHHKPCCGKADIRFNHQDNLIECTNCKVMWVD